MNLIQIYSEFNEIDYHYGIFKLTKKHRSKLLYIENLIT